ncbi:MAG: hypothetical protein ACLFVO_09415 [Chloroflexaceae bacterium]
MTDQTYTREPHLRLHEHWLPLAQQENNARQWGYDAAGLEALILAAAPALRQTHTLLAARAILWHYHRQTLLHPLGTEA